jgi:PBSX family phage portal protein
MQSSITPLRPSRSKRGRPTHTDEMIAYIIKQTPVPRSKQIPDVFSTLYTAGRAIEPPIDPNKLLTLTEENPVHASCLLAKTYDSVGRGWRLGPRVQTRTSELEALSVEEMQGTVQSKLDEICQDLTFEELLFQASWELDAIGWSGWEIARDDADKIAAIYPIPAHTIRATKDNAVYVQIRSGQTRYFKTFGAPGAIGAQTGLVISDVSKEDEANEILVFKTYSPRTQYYGVPRWLSAVSAIAELTAIREYNVSFFSSGGVADALIHVKAANLAAAEKIGTTIMKGLGESRGQGHTSVVTGGDSDSDVVVRFMSPGGKREGQFSQRRDGLINEVLIAHQVPPYRIGLAITGSLGGSAASEMLRTYRIGVVEPRQGIIESRVNKTLFGEHGVDLAALGLRWMLSDISWDETELNLEIAVKTVQFGMFTPNEGRVQMGKEKLDSPEMDRVYMNSALQPLVIDQTATSPDGTVTAPDGTTPTPDGAMPDTGSPPFSGPNLHGSPKPPAPTSPGTNGTSPRRPGATRGPAPKPSARDRGLRGGTGITQLIVNPATDLGD